MTTTEREEKSGAGRWVLLEGRCIGCMVCAEIAPVTFVRSAKSDEVVLGCQPEDAEAIAGCEEARRLCPVDAIARCCDAPRPKSE